MGKVDVAPAQRPQLSHPQPGEGGRRVYGCVALVGGGTQEGVDLLGRVDLDVTAVALGWRSTSAAGLKGSPETFVARAKTPWSTFRILIRVRGVIGWPLNSSTTKALAKASTSRAVDILDRAVAERGQ